MTSPDRNRKETTTMKRLALLLAATGLILGCLASNALAAPLMHLTSIANTTVAPGGEIAYYLQISNVGDEATNAPLTLRATLPAGMSVVEAKNGGGAEIWDCSDLNANGSPGTCVNSFTQNPHNSFDPEEARTTSITILAEADSATSGTLTPHFELYGGGAERPGGGACDPAPPGTPCATSTDPTRVSATPPGFGVDGFDGQVSADAAGSPFTQAGGHPYDATTWIDFNRLTHPNPLQGSVFPAQSSKDVFVELPAGFIGNPAAAARCEASDLANTTATESEPLCPPASQVGVTAVSVPSGPGGAAQLGDPIPVFNMVAPVGVAARFGFSVEGSIVTFDGGVRSDGDYGVTVKAKDVPQGLAVAGTQLTLWGVPADPSHDIERSCPGRKYITGGGPSVGEPGFSLETGVTPPCTADYPRPPLEAFFRNPTSCAGPQKTTLLTDSWTNPGFFEEASFITHNPPGYPAAPSEWGTPQGTTDCEEVPFEPGISLRPTSHSADSPSGLEVDLTMPQEGLTNPGAIAQSDLRKAVVTLPQGMSVNPASANGLGACSTSEIGLNSPIGASPVRFNDAEPSCPDSSKIGTVQIETPLLEEALEGSVFLARQSDNPFGSFLAMYIVATGSGVIVKLPGHVEARKDGQLVTSFDEQPQLPFDRVHLSLFGGPRAPLRTPPACGAYAVKSTLTPWSGGAAAELSDSFAITDGPGGSACPPKPAPFDPKLDAGTQSPIAGAFSPFVLRLTREDASQRLAGLNVALPPGLIGKPAGIPYCPESALASLSAALGTGAAQLASPACPAASQVGVVTVGAGAGPSPFYVQTGKAYLAGPYKGAPLSLAIATPALAGPFDLGNVLVRTALQVNPESAQITAVSDPLPQVLHGIPLDLRDVRVNLERPGFTLNPTSCNPMAITSTVTGSEGAVANPSSRFQVGECARLGFKPKLSIKLKGGTKRSEFPALRATLKARAGDANIAKAVVSLPHSEFLAQSHIRTICTRVQFAADKCPKGSVYGHARAFTPLLDKPLEGPVYLRSSSNPLPDLVVALKGQIEVDLIGRIDSKGGGIRTTFASVPDAPVSKFVLTMKGGSKGLLENSRDLCRSRNRASVLMDGQNGKVADSRVVLGAKGCGEGRKRGH